ncbi:hypothetical protein EDD15DRAFT_2364271 [Pisolithus albus]|nr:hypothetical protein EDD15DRAFT_2364271 [Pisolithus albus]
MDLTYCLVTDPYCWRDIERIFMQGLGIGGPSPDLPSELSQVPTASGNMEATSVVRPSPSTSSAVPLLKDPSAWRLLMDWAEDKIGYGELDEKMQGYGSRYILEEWKAVVNEVFMQSDPGAEHTTPAPLVVQRAMESQGVSFTNPSSAGNPPPGPTRIASNRRRRQPPREATQNKRRKLNPRVFLDIDAEDGDEDEEEEEEDQEERNEEGGSIRYPQEVGPSSKGTYLRRLDALCARFESGVREVEILDNSLQREIPSGIFPPPRKNIYVVEFYSASATAFSLEHLRASCPLDIQQNLPPSHSRSHKEIVLLPPQEGTSIFAFKAHQVLPTRSWVQIRKSTYKGDIGYVEKSSESDAVVLVAPRRLPYDLPGDSGEKTRFDVELARIAKVDLVPLLSPGGAEIRYRCGEEEFVHGLLRLTLPVDTLEQVKLPHPDDIKFHAAADIDPPFVEETLNLFSAQFWREQDMVEIREGDLVGKRGTLADVDWHKQSAVLLCDDDTIECNIRELRRVFRIGDMVEIMAGPFCGEETGYVVAVHQRTIVVAVRQPDQTVENVEVSQFLVRSHLQEHVVSLGPDTNEHQLVGPLSGDEALPGDIVQAFRGPYAGQEGTIEWISPDGKFWVSTVQNPAPGQGMVAMDVSDLRITRAPNTLILSKDKGYDVAVGDTVEVARGQWRHSQGIVKVVDFNKSSLDVVHLADGIQITIPITFVCKIKERSDHALSKFVGREVWVIAGDKKGCRAMLRTLGRKSSWVAIFGQPIQLKNNQVSTPRGMLLDGTLLPPQLQRTVRSLHSRSFVDVPRSITPPPAPGPSNADPSDPWSITPDDIAQAQNVDYGEVPWLFESNFCDFKSFHLGFNVSVCFMQVSLGKRVVRTVCPDRFAGQDGPAPRGSVCVTVTGHNAGSGIQHLTIPAQYLTPANPTGKNQWCLILKGPQAGRIVRIIKCQRSSKSVVTEDGSTIPFSDICLAFEYNRTL